MYSGCDYLYKSCLCTFWHCACMLSLLPSFKFVTALFYCPLGSSNVLVFLFTVTVLYLVVLVQCMSMNVMFICVSFYVCNQYMVCSGEL